MAPTTYHRPDDIDLHSLWRSALRSLPKLAVVSVLLGAATYGVLGMVAPRYMSETQLAIESIGTTNPFADPSRSGASDSVSVRMDKEAINTHVRALMSTDLGEEIVREMKLADLPEFNSARGSPDKLSALLRMIGIGAPSLRQSDQDRALASYFSHLEVYSPKESRFIGIRFTSIDPELAAAVANRIAETYRANLARQSIAATDDVQQALEPKITKLADEAAAAEAAVESFRGQANIFKGGQAATGLNEQQLAELNAELSRVKATRSEAEARAKQAQEMQTLGAAETLADVQKSPLIQNLVQSRVRVERQISELSATLLPGHPRMRQLTADLKGLKVQIADEVNKIVGGLAKEAKVTALREEALQRSVDETKLRIVSAGPEEAKLRSLEADARSKRAELDRLRAQFEANRVRSDDSRTIPVEAQIVSSARPSSVPVFPRKGAMTMLVSVASMMIGLALVITRGLLGGARVPARSARDRKARRERVSPTLPSVPTQPVSAAPLARAKPVAPPSEPVEQARSTPPPLAARPAAAPPVPAPSPVIPEAPVPKAEAKAETPTRVSVPVVGSAAAMAARIEAIHGTSQSGTRTLLSGSSDVFSLAHEAVAVCRRLAENGQAVILVDWSLNGSGIAEPLGQVAWPGFTELMDGRARFEDVVKSLPDGDVHLIPSGRALEESEETLDADSISFLLDALDDVYQQIVVVAQTEAAERLFEAIQGRFDCGITLVANATQKERVLASGQGTFLGFDVDGITLFALEATVARPERRKVARAG